MRATTRNRLGKAVGDQHGQSMLEYVVVCFALAAALLVPVPGIQPPQTVGQLLAAKIHDLYDNLTFFLSLQ